MATPVGIVPVSSSGQNPDSMMAAQEAGSVAPPATNSRLARRAAGVPDAWVNAGCGAVAGAASGMVTCPLDVIKTKLQAQGSFRARAAGLNGMPIPQYKGLVGTATTVWTQDGLRGMYRGLGPMMIGYLPTWAVYMSVYNAAKDAYYPYFGKNPLPKSKTVS
jgi:solute carrier family 25 folate transporter 32